MNSISLKKAGLGVLMVFFMFFFGKMNAQEKVDKKQKRQAEMYASEAEKALSENKPNLAEAKYREAIAADPQNAGAKYNLGNFYYNKENISESASRLTDAAKSEGDQALKHQVYHNQGNAFMKQKKYEQAVGAYKNALRNDPTDNETRYNLALAKKMLEKQQQDNKDKNKDKDNKDNQDNKDKNKDQKGDNKKEDKGDQKDKGDQGKDDQKNKDQKDKNEDGKPKDEKSKPEQKEGDKNKADQQPQPIQGKLSKQQMKNLLEAMENQEKKIQDKINARRAKGQRTQTEKDW